MSEALTLRNFCFAAWKARGEQMLCHFHPNNEAAAEQTGGHPKHGAAEPHSTQEWLEAPEPSACPGACGA